MNRLKNIKQIKYWLIVFLALLWWQACNPSYIPANHFLINDEPENFGYGLYSYLLLNPQKKDSLKCVALLSAFLSKRKELVEISQYKVDSNINIIYLPVKTSLPKGFDNLSNKQQINWVMTNYNFKRAKKLLKHFCFEHSSGPYIISFHQPVSVIQEPVTENFLVQDFTKVPPSVGAMWLDEFIKLSYMNDFQNDINLKVFGESLKTAVGNLAQNVQINKSMLGLDENIKQWITFR